MHNFAVQIFLGHVVTTHTGTGRSSSFAGNITRRLDSTCGQNINNVSVREWKILTSSRYENAMALIIRSLSFFVFRNFLILLVHNLRI